MLIALALFALYEGLVLLLMSPLPWHGAGMMGIGVVLVVLASRGFGARRPWGRRDVRGPTFTPDDPEVADLPPTTTGQLGERIRQARERQKRAGD